MLESRQKSCGSPLVHGLTLLVYALSFSALTKVNAGITPDGDSSCVDNYRFRYENPSFQPGYRTPPFDYNSADQRYQYFRKPMIGRDIAEFNVLVDRTERRRPGGTMFIKLEGNGRVSKKMFDFSDNAGLHRKIPSPCDLPAWLSDTDTDVESADAAVKPDGSFSFRGGHLGG